MCKPEAARARTADSRPDPGPLTRTSMLFIPYWSRATPAAVMEACWAAYGVPLREPLKPIEPAEDQQTARPSGAVMVTIVLLKVAWIQARPCGTTRRSRFFLNSFLRRAAFPAAAVAAPSCCCASLANACPLSRLGYLRAMTFFLAATAPLRGPFRVRALVCVRWPRTGRLRRWRSPR